jgi:hypothetical protein
MEKTFQTLNDLEARGLVTRYAIGGAFGWSFYTEPIVTFDVDVFVFLPNSDSPLVSLSPIYDHLRGLGCEVRHEHVMIAGTAIQFLVAPKPVVEEAIREAAEKAFKQVRIRVFSPEHLMAVMLDTGRPKDFARLAQVVESVAYDDTKLAGILERHALTAAWQKFKERYL